MASIQHETCKLSAKFVSIFVRTHACLQSTTRLLAFSQSRRERTPRPFAIIASIVFVWCGPAISNFQAFVHNPSLALVNKGVGTGGNDDWGFFAICVAERLL